MNKIELGDRVKDPITGIEGIAVAFHIYLHGCKRISVQQKAKEDGSIPEACSFDQPQLELVKEKEIPKGKNDTGGPEKYMPKQKTLGYLG